VARYADSLLTEGEVIVLRTRQHWLALMSRARAALLLWLIGLVLLGLVIYFNVAPGVLRDVTSGVALILLGLGVLVFVYRFWVWWAQDYVVTNRRLLKVTGARPTAHSRRSTTPSSRSRSWAGCSTTASWRS